MSDTQGNDAAVPGPDAASLGVDGLADAGDGPSTVLDGKASSDRASAVLDGAGAAADVSLAVPDAPATSTDGSGSSVEMGAVDSDASGAQGCLAIPTSALHVSASSASGTVVGGNLNAVLCPGGASAYVESAGARYDTVPYFLMIEWTLGTSATTDFDFQSPGGAHNGELSVMVGLNSASAGEYSSPSGQDCGSLAFTYYLPVPAGVDCAGAKGPGCPPGCTSVCSGFGCTACTPQEPSVGYTAQGSTDCMGNSQTPIGSWQLSLTSVTSGDAGTGSGLTYLTPHGSFTATMAAADGSADSVTLSVTF